MIISSKEMVKGKWCSPSLINLKKKRKHSLWAVAHNCDKKGLNCEALLGVTFLHQSQVLCRQAEGCACSHATVFQHLLETHTDVMIPESVCHFMMDLVIKQRRPIPISHLGAGA